MISKEKSNSNSTQSNKQPLKTNDYNSIIKNNVLNKYFIYRRFALNQFINSNEFRNLFKNWQLNYDKQIQNLKKNFSKKEKTKIINKKYICLGGYTDVIKALNKRGWKQIVKNTKTTDFGFIWTLKTCDVIFNELKPDQIANHFFKNGMITRKNGLTKSLRNLYIKGINPDNFFPRCYDLAEKYDLNNFLEDFKEIYALSMLKKFVNKIEKYTNLQIKTAINIINRNFPFLTGKFELISNKNVELINEEEWNIIYTERNNKNLKEFKKQNSVNVNGVVNAIFGKKEVISTKKSKDTNNLNNFNANQIKINEISFPQTDILLQNKLNKNNNKITSKNTEDNETAELSIYEEEIKLILSELEKKLPQYKMNGHRNIWVMKPSNLSRGRGVIMCTTLEPVYKCLNATNSNGLVIQKYIENPSLILNRKYDIRQWVLVTSLEPLTIWMWDEPYLRFSAEDFTFDDLNNQFAHLTNNSIAKYSENFKKETKIEGDMWSLEEFKKYLKEKYKKNLWPEIQKKIQNIVLLTLIAGKSEIQMRNNSFELFGYDVMFDDEMNIYLIEINASPAMDYSTKITERLVKEMIENLFQIVIDNKDNDEIKKIGKFYKIDIGKEEINNSLIPNKS